MALDVLDVYTSNCIEHRKFINTHLANAGFKHLKLGW